MNYLLFLYHPNIFAIRPVLAKYIINKQKNKKAIKLGKNPPIRAGDCNSIEI